ncbi:oxidoreductase [Dyadobacter crusticola]|uniref:oxidoreductase n=1 Tax=Dyadobacter crusticola TaxID=292407 RepID=UPI00069246B2|nr:oxidoreductase [Dyadobacter crusticola]
MTYWSYNDIPDQNGRVALVTGGPSGIGFHIALMLAKKGAEVILTYRDFDKAQEAMDKIVAEYPEAKVAAVKLDLADLTSVAECAAELKEKYNKLDVLINNAGVMVPPFTKTQQGFELQMGTNHLGHFALTGLLLPILIHTPGSRIVSVSSLAAIIGKVSLDDLNYRHRRYNKWEAYGQSKLANLLFIQELSKRLTEHKVQSIAVASHPGGSPTNLQRTSSYFMKKILTPLISQSPSQAALPTLRAACDPAVLSGSYWGPSSFFGLRGYPKQATIPSRALDINVSSQLWELSEKLTGVLYRFD